jgi:hemerythrin-like domain-containing protein
MRPTKVLMDEHRNIERVLDCLERMTVLADTSGHLDGASAREALAFFRGYADRCHHGKEEDLLFPMMEKKGFPRQDGPLAVMCDEHETGRAHIRAMDEAIDGAQTGDSGAMQSFARHARDYVLMLREHIQKEDHCLFRMADEALSAGEQQELTEQFERVDRDLPADATPQELLRIADRLVERYAAACDEAAVGD